MKDTTWRFVLPSKKGNTLADELRQLYPFVLDEEWVAQPHNWEMGNEYRPRFCFEVGSDRSGDAVCLVLDEVRWGEIMLLQWNRTKLTPQSSIDEVMKDRGVVWLSDSFSAFVDSIDVGAEKGS